jgi:AcrR family transcriptional regulator
MALDRDQLARAAVSVLDAEGASGLTMRRLAAEVGAAPMSAYTHVRNKDDLVELALDSVVAEVELPEPDGRVRRPARRLAAGLRAALLAHPGVAEVARSTGLRGTAADALRARMGDCLRAAGVEEADANAAVAALVAAAVAVPHPPGGGDDAFAGAVELVLTGAADRRRKR